MGLSVLIPVYNYNVTSLVQALSDQLEKTGQEGEIILLDDGSSDDTIPANQSLQNTSSTRFFRNEKNEGRMRARQKLSTLARFEWLIFLDCDSEIIKDDFLAAYFDLTKQDIAIASGGRVYADHRPAECDFMLHWKYGRKRESPKGKTGIAFQSNNFLIQKEIFNRLDTSLQMPGYGHEDSWWGIQFEQAAIRCHNINNPVLHASIEKADSYIEKSEQALSNLLLLEKKAGKNLLGKYVRIYRWYLRMKSTGLSGLFLLFEKPFHRYFYRNLLSCDPNLFFFDCYRLAILIRKSKEK